MEYQSSTKYTRSVPHKTTTPEQNAHVIWESILGVDAGAALRGHASDGSHAHESAPHFRAA